MGVDHRLRLTKISVTLFAGGIVMREVTGYSVWTSAVILIVVTGIYTVLGGLRAVIYTEVMQAVVLIIGSATMTVLGLQAVGGWSGLEARVPADFFSMWKPMNHPNFPWTGIVFGAPILASGIGAPTSTSCSGCSRLRTSAPPAPAPSSPGF